MSKKILVAYFSASGVTAKAAWKVRWLRFFYDNESSEETLRYCVEQDLEDAGFNVIDVSVMKWRFLMKIWR